jgi:uroporphyrinogen-III synthase
MHVLITRPEQDAGLLKAQIEAMGHEVSLEPLLEIELLPIAADAVSGAQAIVATSRNGVRALAESAALAPALELPLFAVGPSTGELAHNLGFRHVVAGGGNAGDLIPVIVGKTDAAQGPLVHLAGDVVACDLAAALAGQGIEVEKLVAYRAHPARALSSHTAHSISTGSLDAVVLMSPRTASIFAQLVAGAGLKAQANSLIYLCMSQNVADALQPLQPGRVVIAAEPNSAALLAALTRVAA